MPDNERLSRGERTRLNIGHSAYDAVRQNRWEFACMKSFLKPGVFHLQQIQPISLNRLEARLGALTSDEFRAIGKQLAKLLKLDV